MRITRGITQAFRLLPIMLAAALPTLAWAASVEAERAEAREQSKAVLARLYAASPAAQAAIENAVGYATFSTVGLKLGVAGGGRGKGLVVYRSTGKEVFMRFVEVQAGLGLGIKKYDLIFVFNSKNALDDFVNKGWEYGGQATAAAKAGNKGKAYAGAVSVSPDIWLYQLTSGGLAAELTLKGSKYFKDKSLN